MRALPCRGRSSRTRRKARRSLIGEVAEVWMLSSAFSRARSRGGGDEVRPVGEGV